MHVSRYTIYEEGEAEGTKNKMMVMTMMKGA